MFKKILLVLIVFGIGISSAFARGVPQRITSFESFKKMPVLYQGRIKPIDTYARNLMRRFSGKSSFNKRPAIEWLAKLLFAPGTTREDKIFLINNSDVLEALGIVSRAKGRYSFSQLEQGLPKLTEAANAIKKNNQNIAGNEILNFSQNVMMYTNLANSFSFAVPNPDFQINRDDVVQLLDLPQGKNSYSFFDIASKAEMIMSATGDMNTNDPKEKTPQEEELVRLLGNLYRWSMSYENESIALIPTMSSEEKPWLSPWEAINREFKNSGIKKEVGLLQSLAVHYRNGEQLQFDMAARAFQNSSRNRIDLSNGEGLRGLNLYRVFVFVGGISLLVGFGFTMIRKRQQRILISEM